MAAHIHGESTPDELNSFLTGLQARANHAQLKLVVIRKEVCFRNADNRRAHYGDDPDDVRPYELATNVALIGRQSGTLLMVASAPNPVWELSRVFRSGQWTDEDRDAHRRGEADWHCFAMYFRQGKCFIYDSSYLPASSILSSARGRRRLGHLPNLHMARNVVKAWRARLHLKEIWVGGGGNEGHWCRTMTAQWMDDLVARLETGSNDPVDIEGWEKVFI